MMPLLMVSSFGTLQNDGSKTSNFYRIFYVDEEGKCRIKRLSSPSFGTMRWNGEITFSPNISLP